MTWVSFIQVRRYNRNHTSLFWQATWTKVSSGLWKAVGQLGSAPRTKGTVSIYIYSSGTEDAQSAPAPSQPLKYLCKHKFSVCISLQHKNLDLPKAASDGERMTKTKWIRYEHPLMNAESLTAGWEICPWTIRHQVKVGYGVWSRSRCTLLH